MERPITIKSVIVIYVLSIMLTIPTLLINARYAPEEQSESLIITLGLIFMIPYLVIGYFMYKQKNWARIIYTFFGLLSLFPLITPTQEGINHISVFYLNWLQTSLMVVMVILLFMPKSNTYFRI